MNLLNLLASKVAIVLLALHLISAPTTPPPQNFGAVPGQAAALYNGYLASGIGTTDTSMTLSTGTFGDGTTLSGWQCFTVDVNSPSVEYICGTASGTAVSGLMRGVLLSNPNATSSSLAYQHYRFATVQITDYPDLEILRRQLVGLDDINNVLHYVSTISTTTIGASGYNLTDVNYLNNVVAAGASPISPTVAGIGLLATQSQTANGTATGTYNATVYSLLPNNQFFSVTSTATTTVPVTGTNGKLSQNFLDLTQPFTFTGTTTLATTTLQGVALSVPLWNEIGETTLASPARSVTVSGLPIRKSLHIVFSSPGFATTKPDLDLSFNADSGNDYTRALSLNFGASSTGVSQGYIDMIQSTTSSQAFIDIENNALSNKLVSFTVNADNGGVAVAPKISTGVGEWVTSTAITSIKMDSSGASNLFGTSTVMTVYGSDD